MKTESDRKKPTLEDATLKDGVYTLSLGKPIKSVYHVVQAENKETDNAEN